MLNFARGSKQQGDRVNTVNTVKMQPSIEADLPKVDLAKIEEFESKRCG